MSPAAGGIGREQILAQIAVLGEVRGSGPRDRRFQQWRQITTTLLQRMWPEEPARAQEFCRIQFSVPTLLPNPRLTQEHFEKGCNAADAYLNALVKTLEGQPDAAPAAEAPVAKPSTGPPPSPVTLVKPVAEAQVTAPEPAPEMAVKLVTPSAEMASAPDGTVSNPGETVIPAATSAPEPTPPSAASPPPAPTAPPVPLTPPAPVAPPAPVQPSAPPQPPAAVTPAAPPKPPVMAEPIAFVKPAPVVPPQPPAAAATPPSVAPPPPPAPTHAPDAAQPRLKDMLGLSDLTLAPPDPSPEPTAREAPVPAPPRPAPIAPPVPAVAKPVVSISPAPAPRPAGQELVELASQLEALGVPASDCGFIRATLVDLGRQAGTATPSWFAVRDTIALSLAHPRLARRLLPLLMPYLDVAA